MSAGFMARYADDRLMPLWKVRQAKRRQYRVAVTLLRGVVMLAMMLAAILLVARSVGAQSLVGESKLTWTIMAPQTIKQWKDMIGWDTIRFTSTAPDQIKICADVSADQRCITLGDLRAMKPKESK